MVVAGLGPDVRGPGMFAALVSGGVAVLVVRGEDGVLRAFSNTCRHHDPFVVAEREAPGGRAANTFACPFADWPGAHTAGDGRVRPLPVVETHGVVFVWPRGGATVDAGALVEPETARALDDLGLDRYERVHEERDVRAANRDDVVDGLRRHPGAHRVGKQAVVVIGAAPDTVELRRAFALTADETVVDVVRYAVRPRPVHA
jgi:phenylpropionate dioxygenase-like ring-hydroxylating dioxygenase large terminal subunit